MTVRHLSSEIVSLIHHVELNESGWWKKAIGQVIKGVLWKAPTPWTLNEIKIGLQRELSIRLGEDILQKQLEILTSQGALTRMPGPNYKLTEQTRHSLTAAHTQATAEQEACRTGFLLSCVQHCPDLVPEDVWEVFTRALLDAIQVAGANLFHLLADGNLEKESDWLSTFFRQFSFEHTEGLRKVISAFFAPNNQACRSQVLRLLTAHFFAEASQLRPETISLIEAARKKRTIKVVLDTNFIFSVLQLRDNPADDAANLLLDIAQSNNQKLEIKLYVLPGTLEEAKKTLLSHVRMIRNIRTTSALASAALTQPLPSLAIKFFDAAQRSPGLTADAFYQPYIEDLRTILQEKGIHVLDAHPGIYNTRQDVVDDVLAEQEREVREVPERRRKGYDILLHDVVLWHAVKDRRAEDTDSPFEIDYWAVSIDWRLIAFDRMKRNANASKLPVVLHPNNLVQLIQFWIPRSAALEESLFDSLRLSLYFQQFDPEDEKATVKVLEAISRFENVSDLPESTLKLVLANKALRGKLRDADASNDKVFELVREELLSEHSEAVRTLGQTQGTLARTEASLQEERGNHEDVRRRLFEVNAQLEEACRRAAEAERRAADTEAASLQQASDTQQMQQQNITREKRLLMQRFFLGFVLMPATIGIGLGIYAYPLALAQLTDPKHVWTIRAIVATTVLLPNALACLFSPFHVKKHPPLATWWLSMLAANIGTKGIMAPAVMAIGAIYQGGVWDGVKALMGWS
jgi:hypothetical protein